MQQASSLETLMAPSDLSSEGLPSLSHYAFVDDSEIDCSMFINTRHSELELFLSCATVSTPHAGLSRRGSRALAAPIVSQDDLPIAGKPLPDATGPRDLRERWPRNDALLASGVAALAQEDEAQDALRAVFVSGLGRCLGLCYENRPRGVDAQSWIRRQ